MTPRSFDSFSVGESASLEHEVTAEDVARFVALTGDDNPVHVDDAYAAQMGLPARVVHGMLTSGFVSTVIGTKLPGPGALWFSEKFNFRAPVFVGDRITAAVAVRRLSPGLRVLVLDVTVTNQHDKVVLDGEAHVQVLEKVEKMSHSRSAVQHAVVTGAGRGIGAAIAAALARDGLTVVVNYRSDQARAQATVDAITAAGGQAAAFQADVTDPEQAAQLIAFATETYGDVDALVNNAGGGPQAKLLRELTWDDVQAHLDSHLRGAFNCVQAVLPGMVERRSGRIVNVTSQAGYGAPPPKWTGYAVAKGALAAFTRSLAIEAGPHNVTVNAVAPGMVDTEMTADVPPRAKAMLASQTPLRRLAETIDVADAVAALLQPAGAYVTGQTIHLSGGQVMG